MRLITIHCGIRLRRDIFSSLRDAICPISSEIRDHLRDFSVIPLRHAAATKKLLFENRQFFLSPHSVHSHLFLIPIMPLGLPPVKRSRKTIRGEDTRGANSIWWTFRRAARYTDISIKFLIKRQFASYLTRKSRWWKMTFLINKLFALESAGISRP
jgi:hypothetical protein